MSQTRPLEAGIDSMAPRTAMPAHVRKFRDSLALVPGAPIVLREFGYYSREVWAEQGLPADADAAEYFGFDPPAEHSLRGMGWCEAAFCPAFETKVIEDRGEHELVQDSAGRQVLCFKGRRSGFMPEYVGHPVADRRSWEEDVKWRLDPTTPERFADLDDQMAAAAAKARQGYVITQHLVGGYMYLRSLFGPGDLLYVFYDQPELIHACMAAWLALADAVTARHQQQVSLDVLFLAEDICYNHGPLIGPDMIRAFLFPYYQQLIANIRGRQRDRDRHLHIYVDTDGDARPVIPLYQEIGLDRMCPFEVASGCDVVEIGRRYSSLWMLGGIDKRVLAQGKAAIDRMVDRILPPLVERGGYIPTCDHGVPTEVSLDDYRHFRERLREFA